LSKRLKIVIAGGAAIGSACGYFLAAAAREGVNITVVEPDPTYQFAASARSASSIRQQFTTPLNIAMSAFGLKFLKSFPRADLAFNDSTYLYLASEAGAAALRASVTAQRCAGVRVRLLDPRQLSQTYPWLNTEDLAAGSDTAGGEGWFDGYSLVKCLRSANESSGVRYLKSRIRGLVRGSDADVKEALLEDGSRLACDFFVNATGTHARDIAALIDLDLPVRARKRCVFVLSCPERITPCPLVIDPTGLWFRADGERYIAGCTPPEDPNVATDDFEVEHQLFDSLMWPVLAHRVPAFESLRVTGSWAGHYDYNEFDQNPFIGPAPGARNFLLASGFSGHGLQHAPAIGRALAEWILHGEYRSIDLAPLGIGRLREGRKIREINVI
jgi:FAD-dependent oxidoreductase domain-containing protein 1